MADLDEKDREALHSLMDLGLVLKKLPKKSRTEIAAWNRAVASENGETFKQLKARLRKGWADG